MYIGFVLIVLAILTYMFSKCLRSNLIPKGLKELPGPIGWPIVGNILSIKGPLCLYLHETSKKYGPIFNFRMGCRNIVILNSSKIITKSLKDIGNIFSGRWQNIWVKITFHDSGVVFKDGEWWSTQRSFVLKVLKNFGLGKERSNEIVSQECAILINDIQERCGQVVSTKDLFSKATVNVIMKLSINMRFENDNENFLAIKHLVAKVTQVDNPFLTLILMYPILENFPRISKFLLWCSGTNQDVGAVQNFFIKIIDERKKNFCIENEGEDMMDMFLKEQYQLTKNQVKDHTFTDWQLVRVIVELFVAGYETTSSTLTWSMLMMAKYPDIQDRVNEELIDVIGSSRMPNITDKKSMTYTQAVMDEIFRFSSVAPLAIPHRVLENTELNGFFIPKDSIVFPNLYASHHDEDVWEKPFEFYPEHFLTTLENGNLKYTPRDEMIVFSIGKRQCLGESLARTEFFMFFTSILQRFRIRFEKKMNEEIFSKITQGTDGIIRAALNSEVVFEKRSTKSK